MSPQPTGLGAQHLRLRLLTPMAGPAPGAVVAMPMGSWTQRPQHRPGVQVGAKPLGSEMLSRAAAASSNNYGRNGAQMVPPAHCQEGSSCAGSRCSWTGGHSSRAGGGGQAVPSRLHRTAGWTLPAGGCLTCSRGLDPAGPACRFPSRMEQRLSNLPGLTQLWAPHPPRCFASSLCGRVRSGYFTPLVLLLGHKTPSSTPPPAVGKRPGRSCALEVVPQCCSWSEWEEGTGN